MQYRVVSVIDDDPSVREGTTDLLESAGIATKSFQDADEFLQSDYLDFTSCVVADVRMPGMSGIELHEQLLRSGKTIPTILITAFPRDCDRSRARQNGVRGYLKKPFGQKELLSHVNAALQNTEIRYSSREAGIASQDGNKEPSIEQICKAKALSIAELSGPDALEAITPEWERLETQLSPRTPFTSPLWVKLWWRHLRQAKPSIRQEFFVHTVRDATGELLAIAPLIITYRPGFGPLRLRILQFFGGADGSITEHRCMICREQDEARATGALVSYLYDRKEKWDLFVWTGIRHNEIAQDHLENRLHVYKTTPYYLVPLPKSWEEFRSGLSPNMKEAMRKCYRHLARDGHTFTFRVVTKSEEISIALNRLFDLHSERAQLKYATRHRDLFAEVLASHIYHRRGAQNGRAKPVAHI